MKEKTFKTQLAKLVDVKSIMTIILMIVFCFLAITDKIDAKDFMITVMAVVTFYFSKPTKKDDKSDDA